MGRLQRLEPITARHEIIGEAAGQGLTLGGVDERLARHVGEQPARLDFERLLDPVDGQRDLGHGAAPARRARAHPQSEPGTGAGGGPRSRAGPRDSGVARDRGRETGWRLLFAYRR